MLKFAHIIMVPMTGVGVNRGFKSDEWFKYRIELFKKYTLKSLSKQSVQNFIVWLTFRPEEENHPYIKDLIDTINEYKVPTIITFHGLMYADDKFASGTRILIENMGRVLRQCYRDGTWFKSIPLMFELIFNNKNKTLLYRLERALSELRIKLLELSDCSYIYLTRIDSDDMLHNEAAAEIQRVKPFEGALVYKNGYVYNSNTNEMAEWHPKTNPPFHTICFLASKFFNPVEHLEYYKDFKSHEDITKVFETKQLEDGRYCVVIHGNHISTIWDHPFRGKSVDVSKLNEFK